MNIKHWIGVAQVSLFLSLVQVSVGQDLAQNRSSQCLEVKTEPGNCSQHSEKWTFDRQPSNNSGGACVKLIYSGCGASENLFDTELECQEVCLSLMPTPNFEAHPQTVTPMTKTTMTGTDNPSSLSEKNWTRTTTHSNAASKASSMSSTIASPVIRFSRNGEEETTLSTSLTPSNGNTELRALNQPELMGPTSTTSHNDLSQSSAQDRMTNGSTNPTESDHDQAPTTITKATISNEINLEGNTTVAGDLMESISNSQEENENHAILTAPTIDSLAVENDSTKTASDQIEAENQAGALTRHERESTLQEPLNGTGTATTDDDLVTTEQQMVPVPPTTFSQESNKRGHEPPDETTKDWQQPLHSDFDNDLLSSELSESQCNGLSTFVAKMFYPLCRRKSSVWTFEDGRCMFDRLGGCKFTLNIFQTRQLCEDACVNPATSHRTPETSSNVKPESNNNRKDDEDRQDRGGWGHALIHKYHAHRDTDANEVSEPKTNIHVSMTGNTENNHKENQAISARQGNTDDNDNRNWQEKQLYHYVNTGDKDPRNMGAMGLPKFPASQDSIASNSRPLAWSFNSNTESSAAMHDRPDKLPESGNKYGADFSDDQHSSVQSSSFSDKKGRMDDRKDSKEMYAGIDHWPPQPSSSSPKAMNSESSEDKQRPSDNLDTRNSVYRTMAASKRQDTDVMNGGYPSRSGQSEGPSTFGSRGRLEQNNFRDEMEPQGNVGIHDDKFSKQFAPYKRLEEPYERFNNNEYKTPSRYGQSGNKKWRIQSKDMSQHSRGPTRDSESISHHQPLESIRGQKNGQNFQTGPSYDDAKPNGSHEKNGDSGEKYHASSKSAGSSQGKEVNGDNIRADGRGRIQRSEVCEEPWSETGLCRGFIKSWTFVNGQCVEFIYGGCGATKNFFHTQLACETACQQQHD
ncbi:uncharacterized protein LOC131888703 isoform X2 [Tigriopus californicus]|uniref:uncharacterized protein LOC131888703 isoform X2 n=1 Tax=Tigriopus californicus TaxID=6832 RepID=UPI0027DA7DB9|nr:uncharacterized protein LOC131888703 isoform X2 [Tigriopus californicus]